MRKLLMGLTFLFISCEIKQNVPYPNESVEAPEIVVPAVTEDEIIAETPLPKMVSVDTVYANSCHDKALNMLLQGESLTEALTLINQAIEISPTANSYYVKGNIQQKMGNLYSAQGCYFDALTINPTFTDAIIKYAIVCGKLGDMTKCCSSLHRACDLGASEACQALSNCD